MNSSEAIGDLRIEPLVKMSVASALAPTVFAAGTARLFLMIHQNPTTAIAPKY
jgi:hypothetical protein